MIGWMINRTLDPAHYRDVLLRLLEQDGESPPGPPARPAPPTKDDIKKREAEKRWRKDVKARWERRKAQKGRSSGGRNTVTATIYHEEFERPGMKDQYGDPILIEIELDISGTYHPGSSGSYYEPSESPSIEDIDLDWAEPVDKEPEGGPLTFRDLVAIEEWFETDKTQEYAHNALMDNA